MVARQSERLEAAVAEARRDGGQALAWACDVTDRGAVEAMFTEVAERYGGVDVLVNSAGIEPVAAVADSDPDDIERTIRTNFLGMVHAVKAVLPIMQRQRRGSIVNLSSSAAWFPLPRGAAYCASKAAVTAFSESLAAEVERDGIQVLVVYPGFVPGTGMSTAHVEKRGAPPRFVHQSLESVSRAVRASIGTRRLQLVLPPYLAWAPIAKILFPRATLGRVAKMQA
jgi:NAD(P)-dependent dehydrogenase (short-subunit alcohol dehydrogenase family)